MENIRVLLFVFLIFEYFIGDFGLFYALLILLMLIFFISKKLHLELIRSVSDNRILFTIFGLLILAMFSSSFFAYHSTNESLKDFLIDVIPFIIFGALLLSFPKNESTIKILMYTFIFSIAIAGLKSLNLNELRVDRAFTKEAELIFPFVVSMFLFEKSKTRLMYFLVCVLVFIETIFTLARGAYVALIAESLIVFILFYTTRKHYGIYKSFKSIVLFLMLIGSIFYTAYHFNGAIAQKINQGLEPSGRDIEVRVRFPVIFENFNIAFGIGYGANQYNKILNDFKVDDPFRTQKADGSFNYWHDEPWILSIFYHHGIVGVLCFISLFLYILKNSFTAALKLYNDDILSTMFISIFSIMIGKFLLRGLAEGISFEHFIFVVFLFAFCKSYAVRAVSRNKDQ